MRPGVISRSRPEAQVRERSNNSDIDGKIHQTREEREREKVREKEINVIMAD